MVELSERALNRATMARQHLLRPSPMTALQMIEHLVGLQSQHPTAAYGGLRARLERFEPAELSTLMESRRAVRILLMRGTVHLVSAADCLGLRPLMQPMLDRVCVPARIRAAVGDPGAVERLALERLAEGPATPGELTQVLTGHFPDATADQLGLLVRGRLPLVQMPPRGVWGKGGATRYQLAQTWLGAELSGYELPDVIRRYLAAFGPATVADVQTWCKLTRLREVTDGMPDLVRYRSPSGADLLDLPDAALPDENEPVPVRLLPEFDNLLLSYAERGR